MTQIALDQITIDPTIQPRAQMDYLIVAEYAEAMKSGAVFPPVVVFHDGQTYWLADGFHRINAAKDYAGLDEFPADVRQGSKRDAWLYGLGANKGHGLRLTNADKRRIVEAMLKDEEWRGWSDGEIADHCGVTSMMVGNHRKTIYKPFIDQSPIASPDTVRKFNRNGKTHEMGVDGIGKPMPAMPASPQKTLYEPPAKQTAPVEPKPEPAPSPKIEQAASRIAIINADAQYLSQHITEPVHLVITSPPYNVGIDYADSVDDLITYIPFVTSVWRQCYKVMVDGARIAVVVPFGIGRNPYIPFDCQIMQTLVDAGFSLRGRIVWDKNTTGNRTSWGSFRLPSAPALRDTTECIIVAHKGEGKLEIPEKYKLQDEKGIYTSWLADSDYFTSLAQDHWVIGPESAQRIKHPAPFPVELVNRLLHFYAYPSAHILDPFAGSGTVGVSAKAMGCNATLVEISQQYCELAKERLNQ